MAEHLGVLYRSLISENEDNDEDDGVNLFGSISGPDSEEIFMELLERYADRNVVGLHRAAIQGNADEIRYQCLSWVVIASDDLFPQESQSIVRCSRSQRLMRYNERTFMHGRRFPERRPFTTGEKV